MTRAQARKTAERLADADHVCTVVRLVSRAEACARARAAGLREAAAILEEECSVYEGDETPSVALDKIERAAKRAERGAK